MLEEQLRRRGTTRILILRLPDCGRRRTKKKRSKKLLLRGRVRKVRFSGNLVRLSRAYQARALLASERSAL